MFRATALFSGASTLHSQTYNLTYEIKLPQFEGPFDLLLFFIERDELDVYDIPISKITDDFLGYLQQMQEMNIEVASEFILVAATLMRIKAKMLLPRKEVDEEGNEIDPRQELVERLIEYKRYKSVIEDFRQLEAIRQQMVPRGNVIEEISGIATAHETEAELDNLSLYRLLKTFQRVLERMDSRQEVQHKVIKYPYTIRGTKQYLVDQLSDKDEVDFEVLFATCDNKVHAIFIFLSMLELVQQHILTLKLGLGVNNFWVHKGDQFTTDITTTAASEDIDTRADN